jgi:hypothetical protein
MTPDLQLIAAFARTNIEPDKLLHPDCVRDAKLLVERYKKACELNDHQEVMHLEKILGCLTDPFDLFSSVRGHALSASLTALDRFAKWRCFGSII